MLELKISYGAHVIRVLMAVVRALNGDSKFACKNTFCSFKAYFLHFSFIIIYQELKSENLH